MGNTTVIDQLIVKLGLDPRDFKKGEKEVAAGVLRTKETVRRSADDMSKGMESAAKSFANAGGLIGRVFSRGGAIGLALAVAVAAGKKVNDMLFEVAENTRRLGIDARNFNTTASGLRNMQNAAELAGGSLEDATAAAGTLSKSLFDLKFQGQISEQLLMLARLGVRFTDASGKARDFKDVTLDTADALERAQRSGMMSASEAFQFAQSAGFSGGMAQLVTQGRSAVSAAIARQQGRRQVTASDVDAANKWVESSLSRGQAAMSEIGVPLMAKDAGANVAVNTKLESAMTGGAQSFGSAVERASEALGELADNAKKLTSSFGRAWAAQGVWAREQIYGPALDAAADKNGIDRAVFRGIARVESGFDPNAVSKKGARGIMQLMPRYFPNAGRSPYDDIQTAGKEFARLLGQTEGTEQERYIAALRMYNAGETNFRNGTNLGPENRAYAGKVLAGTTLALPTPGMQGAASQRTDITFESVTINTRAQDGEGIANDFVDSTRRKMNAAQADTGMN